MNKKIGLVLEGGAIRGLFTAGIIDAFLDNNIEVDGIIGVSAGAVFGCNYKSRQRGRVLRYNLEYCKDKRFCSLWSLITTGDLYGARFCYETLPNELDVFDRDAYNNNPMKFYAVATDCLTGKPYYKDLSILQEDHMLWFRASASMPFVSRPVKIDNSYYLDGGISDSIPLKAMEDLGYDYNIVIETRPLSYSKKDNEILNRLLSINKYKNIGKDMANRAKDYNWQLEYVKKREKEGKALVIRPDRDLPARHMEKDQKRIKETYDIGYNIGIKYLADVKKFIS